jgi:hypothetical protein
MLSVKHKDREELLKLITELTPEEFVGLARLLKVRLSVVDKDTGEYLVRDAEDILNDCLAAFNRMKHKERKAYIAAIQKGRTNGSRT